MKKLLLSLLISASFALPAFADKKIAVLPLTTSNNKEETKQFSLGTMSAISHALSKIPGYIIVDRGQIESLIKEISFQNSGLADGSNVVKFGKISGVNILVGGTIQESNSNYRININFTDVQTNNIIKTFQVTGKDIFELQDKLSSEILKDTDITVKSLMETTNSEAYKYFLEAKELSSEFNQKDLEKSLVLLNKSISKDPEYLSAKALRSKVNAILALVLKKNGGVYLDKFSNSELESEKVLENDSKSLFAYDAMYINYEVEGKRDNLTEISNKYPKDKNVELSELNYRLGNFYYNQNKFDDAEYFFLQAVKYDKNAYYNYRLGLTYGRKGNKEKSLEFLLEALKLNPDAFYIKNSIASSYYFLNKYNESLAMYLDIIKMGTDNESDFLYAGLGDTYSALEKHDEAIKAYKKAIELNPKNSYHYYNLGRFYFESNDFEIAENLYNKAIEIDKDDYMSIIGLALVYDKKGRKEEALLKLKKAIKLDKDGRQSKYELISFYERNKMFTEMIKKLNESIKIRSSNPNYSLAEKLSDITNLSKAYSELHDYDNAIKNIKTSIEQEKITERKNYKLSKLKDYYLYYGIDKYKEKKYAEAIELYNKALDVSYNKDLEKSQNVSLYNNIGISYYMINQFDKAIENYKKALELSPNNTDAKTNLEMTYEAIGKK